MILISWIFICVFIYVCLYVYAYINKYAKEKDYRRVHEVQGSWLLRTEDLLEVNV